MNDSPVYTDLVQPRGAAYHSDRIKPWSHYREPVDTNDDRLHGESRRWGDASPETQSRVIDTLIESSRHAGLNPRETAYVLAIARIESGFNPDAAAGTTSASGLGQFIDATGAHYQLNNRNRFDVGAQSDALVAHFIDNRDLARSRGQGEEYIYKYHHDGPTKEYGGLGLSQREVAPHVDRYERFVQQRLVQPHGRMPGVADAPGAVAAMTQHATHRSQTTTFQETMTRMMPSQGNVDPHVTGHYGEPRGHRDHGGVDFNYEGGQQGRNMQHPTVHSPVSGTITFSGGQYGTVKIQDAQGNSHEILHLDSRQVREGQAIQAGAPLGRMGGRGPDGANQYAQHVHYQMRDPNGRVIDPTSFWNSRQMQDERSHAAGNGLIKDGSRGRSVSELQEKLQRLGMTGTDGKQLKVDGNFGPDTRNAVEALQRKERLQIDGIVGPKTDAALTHALFQQQAAAAPGPANPDDRNHGLFKALQQKFPDDTSVEQLTHATVTAHANGITSADKLQSVVMQGDVAYMMGITPGFRASVDLSQPAPSIDQSMAQLDQQQQPQEQKHLHNQRQSMG